MRPNIFNTIQHRLRSSLLSTCVYLAESQGFDVTAVTVVIRKITEVLKVFKAQLKYEGMYLLPLVFEYEPSIWDAYTREHHKAMNLARNLEEMVGKVPAVNKEEDQWFAQLNKAFTEFMQFNYKHMDDEEEVLNEFLWRYYKDDVILQLPGDAETPAKLIKQHESKVYEAAA